MNGHPQVTLSPTRQRGWQFPSLARRAQGAVLVLTVLVAIGGGAGGQVPPPPPKAPPPVKAAPAVKVAPAVKAANVVGFAVAPQQQIWSDEQFEQYVFQNALRQNPSMVGNVANAGAARQQLESLLALQVESIDRTCRLTDEQKKKVQLIGKGDIKRLFEGVERLKEKFRSVNNEVNRLQEIMPDITPFQTAMQAGPFQDDSLLYKSLHNTLTAEQFARYEAAERERRIAQHQTTIGQVVSMLDQSAPLRDTQRRDFIAFLSKETKPLVRPGNYDRYIMLIQIGRLPEEKVKPLLSDVQWQALNSLLDKYRELEPQLRQMGAWSDEVTDKDDAPTAPKK